MPISKKGHGVIFFSEHVCEHSFLQMIQNFYQKVRFQFVEFLLLAFCKFVLEKEFLMDLVFYP